MPTCECGASFTPDKRHPHQKHCSIVCYKKFWARRNYGYTGPQDRKCLVCKKPFTTTKWNHWKAVTCSPLCCRRLDYVRRRKVYLLRAKKRAQKNRAAMNLFYRERRKLYPLEAKARSIVSGALRNGTLARPGRCSQCQKTCKPQAHHDDYSKPLEVRWLCIDCHSTHHRPWNLGLVENDGFPQTPQSALRE